ncbi:acetyltransferase (GNAT) family protein [Bogoriella caseilytica]|uniref:Acetyltransferase (GNAT) family protein n=1 Tax=Bogoriella caseilytica TaxID=56055 RepID=A0A3N2B9M8_9MICO|nr:acetyltransferase (GNAT) family protein [Bogoriella caseilytica]
MRTVPEFRAVDVETELARDVLAEYFTSRELGFTGGLYQVTWPTSATFTPPDGVFLVAEHDDVVAGCGGVRRVEPSSTGETRFEVKHLWVREEARGRGVGAALLQELEVRARALGAHEMVLDTNRSLTAAARLYAAAGYQPTEPYNDNPNATDWFAKRLPGA